MPDRARLGRARADPDDRAGVAADAPPAGDRGDDRVTMRACRPGSSSSARRARARARLEAGRRAGRERGRRRARERRDRAEPRVRCVPDVDPLDAGRGRRAGAGRWPRARRRRSRGAARGRGRRCPRGGRRRGLRPDARPRRGSRRSKAFCHEVADGRGRPRWRGRARSPRATAGRACDRTGSARPARVVVKADGLAAGKGVTVYDDPGRAPSRARSRAARPAGAARRRGAARAAARPASSRSATAATRVALPAARDHKRLGDGDLGPNTGGMGAYSPLAGPADEAVDAILETLPPPILAELARRGTPFRGLPLRGADADRRRPGAPRVQRPVRRSRGPGRSCRGSRSRSGRAARRGARRAGRLGGPTRLPVAARARPSGSCSRREGYPGRAAAGDADRRPRRRRATGALVFHAGTRAAPTAAGGTNGGRVADRRRARRGPRGGARPPPRRPPERIAAAALQRRHDIGARPRRGSPPRRRSRRDDPRATRSPRWARSGPTQARFEQMLRVELAVSRAQARRGVVPPDALAAIEARARSTSSGSPRSSARPTTTSSRSSARSPRPSARRGGISTSG